MLSNNRPQIARFILIPSVITLGITLLRVLGEVRHWLPTLFNPAPGGDGCLVGITWLVPIFGIYFALKLAGAGEGPARSGRAIGLAVFGLIVMAGGLFLAVSPQIHPPGKLLIAVLSAAVAAALQFRAWPHLAKVLLAYGYAARIPVVILTFFAIQGNWGTHYDAVPPGFTETSLWPRFLQTVLVPQLVFWVAFTVQVGTVFGSIAADIFGRRSMGISEGEFVVPPPDVAVAFTGAGNQSCEGNGVTKSAPELRDV
jgi:hypothetical protein